MPSFKDNDFFERRQAADTVKRATLERFHAEKDNPATAERKAARLVAAQARESRVKSRAAAEKAETVRGAVADKMREEEVTRLGAENEERMAVERRAHADEALALLAEQKAARDSRYAARKARKR